MTLLLITSGIEEGKYTSAIFFLSYMDFQHVTQMISENAGENSIIIFSTSRLCTDMLIIPLIFFLYMEICSPDVASFANLAIKTFYNLWLCKGAVDWKMS